MKLLYSMVLYGVQLLLPSGLWACDICGCAAGNAQVGILALTQRHLAGIRWHSQAYRSRPHGSGEGAIEYFQTADVWGRWQIGQRLQLTANIPLRNNMRQLGGGLRQTAAGLGDINVQTHVSILPVLWQGNTNWQQFLLLGAGMVLPSGSTNKTDGEGTLIHANAQPGSGSWNALASFTYMLKYKAVGVLAEGSTQRPVAHTGAYEFGRRNMYAARFFWNKKIRNSVYVPFLSVQTEHARRDFDGETWLSESGGQAQFVGGGLDLFTGRFTVSGSVQVPVYSNLAQGYVTPQTRVQIGIALALGQKKKTPIVIPPPVPIEDFIHTHNSHKNSPF